MFEVRDGSRKLQFDGDLLGSSTSWRRNSERWIEFELYKTKSGSYVLSRVGVSLVFHGAACPLVKRYSLIEADSKSVRLDAIPCEECRPSLDVPVVFPERDRTWAQVSEDPDAILEALYKYDQGGTRYLTNVAHRLLEQASAKDPAIESVYRVETIP